MATFTFWIEKSRHSILFLHDMEGYVNPLSDLTSVKLFPLDKIWTIAMNNGIEGHTVSPRTGKVRDFDAWVPVCGLSGPPKKGFLGRYILLSDNNIWDLKQR